jgi:hypothetical protein
LRRELAGWTEYDTNGALSTDKGKFALVFKSKHDKRETKGKSLPGTGEGNSNYVST